MLVNRNQILSKFVLIFLILGWVNTLHADCSENEIKALFSEEVMEMKKKGFFDFKDHALPPNQNNESRYYFIAKKHSLGGVQVYGGVLVADTRVCEGLKESNLERLKPLFVSDFKKVGLGSGEDCSLDRVKNIIYENLNKSDENIKWEYPYGNIMKSWEYYEFLYIVTTSDSLGVKYGEYLGRMEITKSSCSVKRDDMILIWAIWRSGNLNGDPVAPSIL